MSALHYINSAAWFANSMLWTFWTGVPLMGIASLLACLGSFFLARGER